jgi:hypothetical protein
MAEQDIQALAHTIALIRRYPDLETWWRRCDTASATADVVRAWQQHPAVAAAAAERRWHRQDRFLARLLSAGRRHIEDADERLVLVYAYVTQLAAWHELPASARDLYDALHVKAAYRGRFGGPAQLMSHRLACDFIEVMTGREHTAPGICYARKALAGAGLVSLSTARPLEGRRPTSVYGLLPRPLFNKALSTGEGLVKKLEDSRPWLDVAQVEAIIARRQRGYAPTRQSRPAAEAAPGAAELEALLAELDF